MTELNVRPYKDNYGLFSGERLLIHGLTRQEAVDACRGPNGRFAVPHDAAGPASPEAATSAIRGRKLILEPHLDNVMTFLAHHPFATIRDIDLSLRRDGIVFSSPVAIKNLLRRFDIKLAADRSTAARRDVIEHAFDRLRRIGQPFDGRRANGQDARREAPDGPCPEPRDPARRDDWRMPLARRG